MPKVNQIARFCMRTGINEVRVRSMMQRGYRWSDIELLFGTSDESVARRAAGEAIEAAIRKQVARTGMLPCGEPVRINQAKMERETWEAFQFETGTKGDFYLKPDALVIEDDWGADE